VGLGHTADGAEYIYCPKNVHLFIFPITQSKFQVEGVALHQPFFSENQAKWSMVYKSWQAFIPFCHNARVWQTDGQAEFSSQNRICILCSAVKTMFCRKILSQISWRTSVCDFFFILHKNFSPAAFSELLMAFNVCSSVFTARPHCSQCRALY